MEEKGEWAPHGAHETMAITVFLSCWRRFGGGGSEVVVVPKLLNQRNGSIGCQENFRTIVFASHDSSLRPRLALLLK